jgi:hypothetical protein
MLKNKQMMETSHATIAEHEAMQKKEENNEIIK